MSGPVGGSVRDASALARKWDRFLQVQNGPSEREAGGPRHPEAVRQGSAAAYNWMDERLKAQDAK
ncbi:hypothetical protein GCM10022232_26310 [Streptomyces plumbiresistens]|uniref:Uncharacterized protein n=1 Tax=Streptomyces plumbiresistens TaxID=511811 RepID=A0ABP7R0P2_9ACTN